MYPSVAIIIVNWNKKDYLLNLLNSLKKFQYDKYDIIVVDNASTDGSVDAIKHLYPGTHLILNSENLGGTGGFNSGMKYALEKGEYKYIWLLDNDAEVAESTLEELVKVMERDTSIGIAGSRIVDIQDKSITIEAGSFFRWDTIEVKPLYRNVRNLSFQNSMQDVDYVAICSALVRIDALKQVGVMDERYFIFWDDMDWGMQFKKKGYKVVAVLNSIAYHPAFTEKRNPIIDFYYANRNALLTYSKHTTPLRKLIIFWRYLRYKMKVLIFLGLRGEKDSMYMGFIALSDFVSGRWGKRNLHNVSNPAPNNNEDLPKNIKKIIILNSGNKEDILESFQKIQQLFPKATYTLFIESDRKDMFKDDFYDVFITDRSKKNKMSYLFHMFLKILLSKYDIAVNPKHHSPFSSAARMSYTFNSSTKTFSKDKGSRRNIVTLVVSLLLGEITSIFLLPIIYFSSFKYRKT